MAVYHFEVCTAWFSHSTRSLPPHPASPPDALTSLESLKPFHTLSIPSPLRWRVHRLLLRHLFFISFWVPTGLGLRTTSFIILLHPSSSPAGSFAFRSLLFPEDAEDPFSLALLLTIAPYALILSFMHTLCNFWAFFCIFFLPLPPPSVLSCMKGGRICGKLLNLPHLFGVFYGYARLISILNVRIWCFGVVFGSCTAFYEWLNLHITVLKVISLLIGWKWASQLASRNPWLWLAELCLALCWLDESNWRLFLIGWWAELTCI